MHRSGTSMVTEALWKAGLYLGDDEDLLPPSEFNARGYFEHDAFVTLNDEILSALGGAWDHPPRTSFPWIRRRLTPLREQAGALVREMQGHGPWGWKDPRTSLTLPFWRAVIPGLRVVLCVREPAAVADSMVHRDGHSREFGIALWTEYNRRLLRSARRAAIVTAFESYFTDAERQVRGLVQGLGLDARDEAIAAAAATVDPELRHHRVESDPRGLPRDVIRLHRRLMALATD
jgi:hypothetical protein